MKNIKPVIVLTVICVAVALLLAGVNMLTEPIIKGGEEQKIYDSFRIVLDGEFEDMEIPDGSPKSVTAMYKVTENGRLKGHVVTLVRKGYAGDISVTVGIDADGKVTKAVVTNQSETHGKAGMASYPDNFAGKDQSGAEGVETFSGATVSSTAIKNAVIDALKSISGKGADEPEPEEKPIEPARDEEEILELADELVPNSKGFEKLTLSTNKPSNLVRLYKETSGKGFVMYIVVPGAYVPVATEALVHVGLDGKIQNINLLQWVVGGNPPAEQGNFADGFVGTNSGNVGDAPLVSGATGTSQDFRNAVKDALVYTTREIKKENTILASTPEAELIALVEALVSDNAGFEDITSSGEKPEHLHHLYKENGGKGYVLHIVVPGDYVPVATEALIYVDINGDISNINLIQWVVGGNPPAEQGDFADGFIGKDNQHIDDAPLVSGATGTSQDFRNAVSEAMNFVSQKISTTEKKLLELADELVPNSKGFEKLEIEEGAPEALRALYRETGGKGYIAHIIVPGEYVPVATEALVYFDSLGKIKNVNLMKWIVGHGIEAGDFASGFIGKTEKDIESVELVTSATGTSGDLRNAIKSVMPYIPKDFPIAMTVGIAVLVLSIISFVAYRVAVNKKRRGTGK